MADSAPQVAIAHSTCIVEDCLIIISFFIYIKIINNTLVSTGSYVLTEAQIENMAEVRCSMTSGARRKKRSTTSSTRTNFYLVSVTNNGVNFSDSVPVIAYDSSCNTCTTTDTYVFCELRVRIVYS